MSTSQNARFNQNLMRVMRELDAELASRMLLRTASRDDVYIFMLELGRLHGFDLARGDVAYVHPANLPIGYRAQPGDVVVPNVRTSEEQVLFVPMSKLRRR